MFFLLGAVGCSLFVAHCVLFVVCGVLFVACRSSRVCVDRWLLLVACGLLFFVRCWFLVGRWSLSVV